MAQIKFNPNGQSDREQPSLIQRREPNSLVELFKVILILVMVRFVMLISGMPFFHIPYVDGYLYKLIAMFK